MGDEEGGGKYAYEGPRAAGVVEKLTAGEPPKVLTKKMTLLGPRDGDGRAAYAGGSTYAGGYARGARGGAGVYTYAAPPPADGEPPAPPLGTYDGQWAGGERSGIGTLTYASGAKYQGSWRAGKFEGPGTMFYANGDLYTGDWARGKRHGEGTYVYKASGARVAGKWAAGALLSGEFKDAHGNGYAGEFTADGGYAAGGAFALASGATEALPVPPEEARYGPLANAHRAAIFSLFKKIDADGDGYLVAGELRPVVAEYTGEAFDEAAFFGWFDVHGAAGGAPDARLDLHEFGWYLADICEGFDAPAEAMAAVLKRFEEIVAGPEATRYGPILDGHAAAVEALFRAIDADGDGYLVAGELKAVVAAYDGEAFDEATFFGWFDVHGAGGAPDARLDLREFGWYLADICEGFGGDAPAKMPTVLDSFKEIVAGLRAPAE